MGDQIKKGLFIDRKLNDELEKHLKLTGRNFTALVTILLTHYLADVRLGNLIFNNAGKEEGETR
jgi:hypothetical protein